MSNPTIELVMTRAIREEKFRELLIQQPEAVLEPYNLTDDDKKILLGVDKDLWNVLSRVEVSPPKKWYKPDSFKEAGATIISLVLLILLIGIAIVAVTLIDNTPLTYQVGDNVQFVDTFQRAKDLLSLFFPLFGALISFWLGVTVEGRRGDQLQEQVDVEKQGREEAQAQADEAQLEAADAKNQATEAKQDKDRTLHNLEVKILERMGPANQSAFESRGSQAAGAATQAAFSDLLQEIRAART